MTHGEGVKITKKRVYKKFKSDLPYNKELTIYKMKLPYVAEMISYDDNKKLIVINNECCMNLAKVPFKDKPKYYKQAKDLYFKFKKDTGFYLYDYRPQNMIVNDKTGVVKLIDFEYYGKQKNIWKSNINFLKKIGVVRKDYSLGSKKIKSTKKYKKRFSKKTLMKSKKNTK